MSLLLVLGVLAAGIWVAVSILARAHASDPSSSVRGFSEAMRAMERAPRRRRPLPRSGARRP